MVGRRGHGRRPAVVRRAQRPRHRGPARRDARGRGATGWCWRRRWWSTARAATSARSTASRRRRRAASRRSRPATSRTTARPAAGRWPGRWSTRTPGSTRAAATPPARSRQEHYVAAWARQARGAAVALRYHNVYGPRMPRDTPYSGVAAIFRSSLEHGQAAAGLRGRRPDARLRARRTTSPAPTCWRSTQVVAAADRVVRGLQRLLRASRSRSGGSPSSSAAVREPAGPGAGGQRALPPRRRPPRRRLAGHGAATELGFTAQIRPEQGLPEFATAPLRRALTVTSR